MISLELIHPAHVLKTQIEAKRNQMIATGMQYGLGHAITLQISQELDELLNSYNKMNKK